MSQTLVVPHKRHGTHVIIYNKYIKNAFVKARKHYKQLNILKLCQKKLKKPMFGLDFQKPKYLQW